MLSQTFPGSTAPRRAASTRSREPGGCCRRTPRPHGSPPCPRPPEHQHRQRTWSTHYEQPSSVSISVRSPHHNTFGANRHQHCGRWSRAARGSDLVLLRAGRRGTIITGRTSRKAVLLERAGRFACAYKRNRCRTSTSAWRGPIVGVDEPDLERDRRPLARHYLGIELGDRYIENTGTRSKACCFVCGQNDGLPSTTQTRSRRPEGALTAPAQLDILLDCGPPRGPR